MVDSSHDGMEPAVQEARNSYGFAGHGAGIVRPCGSFVCPSMQAVLTLQRHLQNILFYHKGLRAVAQKSPCEAI